MNPNANSLPKIQKNVPRRGKRRNYLDIFIFTKRRVPNNMSYHLSISRQIPTFAARLPAIGHKRPSAVSHRNKESLFSSIISNHRKSFISNIGNHGRRKIYSDKRRPHQQPQAHRRQYPSQQVCSDYRTFGFGQVVPGF